MRRLRVGSFAGLGLVAMAVALELTRPFASGAVGFDSAASVLHFDRIVDGRHLEAFVTATPKPLLTLVYGLTMSLFDDWRAIAVEAAATFAGCVILGTWLAGRLAGPAGGAFALVALLGSRSLLADVSIAYAVPWALLLCLVAGLALTGERSRPLLAGIALALATLARFEVVVLLGIAAVVLPLAWLVRRRTADPLPRHWWLLLVAWLAIPVILVHDLLLTGDPWFWTTVSARYSAAAPDAVLTPLELVRAATVRYAGLALVCGLAAIGLGALALRRAISPLLGLAGLTIGVGGLLVLLAIRETYVSYRYFFVIDVSLVVAAAIGSGVLITAADRRWRARRAPTVLEPGLAVPERGAAAQTRTGRPAWAGSAVRLSLAVILAAAAAWPLASLDASFRSAARDQRFQAEHADRVVPVLRCAIARIPSARAPDGPGGTPSASGQVVALVPTLMRPRLARDLALPLFEIGGIPVAWLDPATSFLPEGRLVFHDRRGDRPAETYAVLEVATESTIDGVTLTPLLADEEAGIWVLALSRGDDRLDLAACVEGS